MVSAIATQGERAKKAARELAKLGAAARDKALSAIAEALLADTAAILEANARDFALARENGMRAALLDRLLLTEDRVKGIARGVLDIAALPDPLGRSDGESSRPNGLRISARRVPLGVVAIIYEARPNVTADAAALCLKSGNAVILRGGKEAHDSNYALVETMRRALRENGLPEDAISLVADTSRESVGELMNLTGTVDLLIPRGGAGLIKYVCENAKVPVVQTGVGNCHVYVEKTADLDNAANIIFNAKCSRPSVCNAAETLLVDAEIAAEFLPKAKKLLDTKNTELRGCPETRKILPEVSEASETDWETEFLDYILAVKVVSGIGEAIEHIAKYGSGHSEAIITDSYAAASRFTDEIDAAAVYVNASTRFTDGGEFGLGAEIGISTQKTHARGPMGVEQLTSLKYVVHGSGQTR
ncbi:MAG: glutamate-5-semialdehyde dehydrogenase [Oscillospiraceae bacterium]|jgi:glutamate-5-semialdehyde dehydrogenase|nr:glutamate-5-semialdehyde dehydrogenase [Oscillospiraceae bacterium]